VSRDVQRAINAPPATPARAATAIPALNLSEGAPDKLVADGFAALLLVGVAEGLVVVGVAEVAD